MSGEPELILTWFRLLAHRRGAWLQSLWSGDDAPDGRATVTHAEFASLLADADAPESEAEWVENEETVRRWRDAADEAWHALTAGDSRLVQLARIFSLGDRETQLLALCAAVTFDPSLARACAYLQDHSGRAYMTADLAARLLGGGRVAMWAPEMNIFRWELIHRGEAGVAEPPALQCDPQIADWLRGVVRIEEALLGAMTAAPARGGALPEWPIEELADWIRESLVRRDAVPLRVVVVAPRGGGKRAFAAAVAKELGLALAVVDAGATDDAALPRFVLRAERQALLEGAAPAWSGEAVARRAWPDRDLLPLQFLLCEPGAEPKETAGAADRVVRLGVPGAQTRERLWRRSSPEAAEWPGAELRKLADQHSVWPGDIEHVARLGARTPAQAALLVRETARARFGNLAQILETPFAMDDLVLPPQVKATLEAIAFEAENRVRFWEQLEARRLFPLGRGLTALFSGPPGTGKTMAAQVIAARLGQDLCRVNIAQLVSKWVGETAKNYEQIIRIAEENNVVLFFDEADALFARRSAEIRDAQDRFANTDTAFLLQAIESYQGIAILATNLKSNLDTAFLRRLRYVVEFPKPEAALRRQLWTSLIAALAGERAAEALAEIVDMLAASVDVTGAQIKLAILGALFAARADDGPLAPRHLLTGLDRELAKEGRAIGPRERDRILKAEEGR